ncbi:MAG: DUF7901 domain-containing protein [Phycisphaerales bacterium]
MGRLLTIMGAVVLMTGAAAMADWDVGDSYKMHFPQLPDANGLDIALDSTQRPLADDWTCTRSGAVSDIHFWTSWASDNIFPFTSLLVAIYADVPANGSGYSHPGELLWDRLFTTTGFTVRPYGTGLQGYYNPFDSPVFLAGNHNLYQQVNITGIVDPFVQQQGTVYWLAISAQSANGYPGWKTANTSLYPSPYTGNHYLDDAVFFNGSTWQELFDPRFPTGQVSLDLAFVITPEPASLALLALPTVGGLSLLRRRHR